MNRNIVGYESLRSICYGLTSISKTVWMLLRIISLPRELVVASLFLCVVPDHGELRHDLFSLSDPTRSSTGERKNSFARKEERKRKQQENSQIGLQHLAAESFSGMEAMTPREIKASAKTESRQTRNERLSRVRAHCFGQHVDCVRAATPQCRVFTPRVLCPLATASYAKDTGLIIPHVSPN
jgi:hypothetical protein